VLHRHGFLRGLLPLFLLLQATAAEAGLLDISDPGNVVSGSVATVSSEFQPIPALGNPVGLTDNLAPDNAEDAPFIFHDTDPDARISLSGFEGRVERVRFFTADCDGIRIPSCIDIRSSTTAQASLTESNYETHHGAFHDNGFIYENYAGVCRSYVDIDLPTPSPEDTRSLWLGICSGGARLYEVQVFLAPEPRGPFGFAAGIVVLGVLARRRRPSGD
jgi:hypothetical protein